MNILKQKRNRPNTSFHYKFDHFCYVQEFDSHQMNEINRGENDARTKDVGN